MSTSAFAIPLWADFVAVAIGSIQGSVYASGFRERRIDLLGVAIIGVATGLGGGVLRDLALGAPLASLSTNWYLPAAAAAALLGMALARLFRRLDGFITVLDALTIGLFGAIGATKALSYGLPEVPAVFVGVIAAVGGGMLRDILLGIPIAVMHVGSLYAVAAGAGTVFIVGSESLGLATIPAASIGAAVTLVVRLLAWRFGWSLPEQRVLSLRVSGPLRIIRRERPARRASKVTPTPDEYGSTATGTIYRVEKHDPGAS